MIPLNLNVNVSDRIPLLAMPTKIPIAAGARSTAVRTIEMLNSVHVLKKTFRFLLIFLICDIFNLIGGISCFCYGTWVANELAEKFTLLSLGKAMMMLGLVSGSCNMLTRIGIRMWKRVLLVPYLFFLLTLLAYVLIGLSQSVKHRGVQEGDVLSILFILGIIYIWHVFIRQWVYMSLPRPVVLDAESPYDTFSSGPVSQLNDSPPKYDALEDEDTNELPDYQEAVAGQQVTK